MKTATVAFALVLAAEAKFCRTAVYGKGGLKNPCKGDGSDYCCDSWCSVCGTQEYCETQSRYRKAHAQCSTNDTSKMQCPSYWEKCEDQIVRKGGKETCFIRTVYQEGAGMKCRASKLATPACCQAFELATQAEVLDKEGGLEDGVLSDETEDAMKNVTKQCTRYERKMLSAISPDDCSPDGAQATQLMVEDPDIDFSDARMVGDGAEWKTDLLI
jgi:hypothetical protein